MNGFYQLRKEDFSCTETINNCFPAHLHKQAEILYVTKGKLKSTINGKEAILIPGDLSFCFPNSIHRTETIENSTAILIIFDTAFVEAYSNELLNYYPDIPFIKKNTIPDHIHDSLQMLLQSSITRQDLRISAGYLTIILGNLLSNLSLISNKNVDFQDTCHVLLAYINDHFTEQISLDSLSKSLSISKYYISHIFSDKIKTSFPCYLNHCRIDYAKHLLRDTNHSITEIGFDCGFNSSRTFYRAFREYNHMTPMEFKYRQALK